MSELIIDGFQFCQPTQLSTKNVENVDYDSLKEAAKKLQLNELSFIGIKSEQLFRAMETFKRTRVVDMNFFLQLLSTIQVYRPVMLNNMTLRRVVEQTIGKARPVEPGDYDFVLSFTTREEIDQAVVYIDYFDISNGRHNIQECILTNFDETSDGGIAQKNIIYNGKITIEKEYIIDGRVRLQAYVKITKLTSEQLTSELTFSVIEPESIKICSSLPEVSVIDNVSHDHSTTLEGTYRRKIVMTVNTPPIEERPDVKTCNLYYDGFHNFDPTQSEYDETYSSVIVCKQNVQKYLSSQSPSEEEKTILSRSLDIIPSDDASYIENSYQWTTSAVISKEIYLERDSKQKEFQRIFWYIDRDGSLTNFFQNPTITFTYSFEEKVSDEGGDEPGDVPEEDPEGCLRDDTLITMADGALKKLGTLKVGDLIMSEDHTPTKIYEIKSFDYDPEYREYVFDNGTIINEVHNHRFFNVDQNFWQRLRGWRLGDRAITINGETTRLVSATKIKKPARAYGIWTESGTYYANGLLTGVAWLNKPILKEVNINKAVDMMLSFDNNQLLNLINNGEDLP